MTILEQMEEILEQTKKLEELVIELRTSSEIFQSRIISLSGIDESKRKNES